MDSAHRLLLQELGNLQEQQIGVFKISCKQNMHGRVFSKAPPTAQRCCLIRLFRWLFRKSQPAQCDNLQHLKAFFEHIVIEVKQDATSTLKQRYRPLVNQAFQNLRNLYLAYQRSDAIDGIIKRNDILEALSVAYRREDSLNELLDLQIQRIASFAIQSATNGFRTDEIPLVEFDDVEEAVKRLREASVKENKPLKEMTLTDVQRHLGGLLIKENVPMGRFINAMYKHDILNYNAVHKLTTRVVSHQNCSERNVSAQSIMKFFKRLHIPLETVWQGEVYAYSEAFGKELREEKCNDSAFQRSLVEGFRTRLLQKAHDKQKEITERCGGGDLIISNSFNRLRIHHVKKGQPGSKKHGVKKKFNIIGKALSDSEHNFRAAKSEKSYIGKFAFSIKNMLGAEDEEETCFDPIVAKRKAVKEFSDPYGAETRLRHCITNMVDRENVTMAIQRLAPDDIHHFTASAQGKILSKAEMAAYLILPLQRKLSSVRQELSRLKSEEPNSPEINQLKCKRNALKEELRQLQTLEHWFKGRPNQEKASPAINILGKQSSVSPLAVAHHSEIPAQNNRKLMMLRHTDRSCSIHAFVGATGVNHVQVTAQAGDQTGLGHELGSMGFGRFDVEDVHDGGIQIQPEIQAGGFQQVGEPIGSFDKNGSTVISIYFDKDMVPTAELDAFSRTVRYKTEEINMRMRIRNCFCRIIGRFFGMQLVRPFRASRGIEIKAKMGDIIGLPKAYVAFEAVLQCVTDKTAGKAEMLQEFYEKFPQKREEFNLFYQSPQERVACEVWDALDCKYKSQELSEEAAYLLEKLDSALGGLF